MTLTMLARSVRHRRAAERLGTGICWVLLAGCGTATTPEDPPSRTDETYLQARQDALARKSLQRRPEADEASVTGEVPGDVMARIREHLAQRIDVPADELTVRRAEAQLWPDGAMGCPQPGMNYTAAPVEGYWIVLEHADRDYDYRVSRSGLMVMCEAMAMPDPPAQ
jgi:hypothetical protein